MRICTKLLQFVLSLFFICKIYGQRMLTFEDCLNIAFENNLSLKNTKISEKIAVYQLTNSKTKILPSVNASLSNNYSWGRGIDPNTNSYINQQFKSYNGSIGSNLTLFNGFSNIIAIKTAKEELELNKTTIQKVKNEITIDIASKFTTILYIQDIIKSNEEQITSSQKQLELVMIKFEQGYVSESEIFKIKSQKSSEELILINNQNLLSTNLLDLKQLLNISLDENIVLIAPKEKFFSRLDANSNNTATISQAIHNNPNFMISKINEKKSKLSISASRSSAFPTLSTGFNLGSTYTNNNPLQNFNEQVNNNLSHGLSFTLSIPIFSQLSNHYKIKESKLTYEKFVNETEIEKNRLSKIIVQSINDANASYSKYESSMSSYEFSKKSYEADVLKFNLGKISTNELLLTKNTFVNAQSQLIQSKYELLYSQAVVNFYLNQSFSLE